MRYQSSLISNARFMSSVQFFESFDSCSWEGPALGPTQKEEARESLTIEPDCECQPLVLTAHSGCLGIHYYIKQSAHCETFCTGLMGVYCFPMGK